jgi:hypothetical protein
MRRIILRCIILLLAVLAASLALAAGVALAQATTKHFEGTAPANFNIVNPCNGEVVHLSGEFHFAGQLTFDAAGGNHRTLEVNTTGVKGTGESGAQYVVQMITPGAGSTGEGSFPITFTNENTTNIIGRGQVPDFKTHFTFHITFNENGDVTAEVLQFRTECT